MSPLSVKKILPISLGLGGLGVAFGILFGLGHGKITDSSPSRPGRPSAPRLETAALDRFEDWLKVFQQASPENDGDADLIRRGVDLAVARQKEMVTWMREDPEGALRRMIPRTVYPSLPAEVRAWVEQPLDRVVPFSVAVACHGIPRTERVLTIGEQDLPVHTYGHRLGIGSKNHLPVHGFILAGEVAMDASPVRVMAPREPATPDSLSGQPWVLDLGGRVQAAAGQGEMLKLERQLQDLEKLPTPGIPGPTAASGEARPDRCPLRIRRWPRIGPRGPKRFSWPGLFFLMTIPGKRSRSCPLCRKNRRSRRSFWPAPPLGG